MDWGQRFQAVGSIKNQGNAPTTGEFKVDVYASPSPTLGRDAVYVGSLTIAATIQPGDTVPFNETMDAPPLAIPSLHGSSSYYLNLLVDSDNTIAESNEINNANRGQGFDQSLVTITPEVPPVLAGVSFSVTPSTPVAWGQSITVSGRVMNNAQGDAPATRARVILTRNDGQAGGWLTLGDIPVPAIPAWQTVPVSATLALPVKPPAGFAGATSLQVTMIQDADFQTLPPLSAGTTQGLGLDAAPLTITQGSAATDPTPVAGRPELSVSSVQVPSQTITWSKPFSVSATIENTGASDAGPFRVRFLLVDDNRPSASPLALGDVTIAGLKAGFRQTIDQATIDPHGKLPDGVLPSAIAGRIVAVVDPENTVDEANETNNTLPSSPVSLRLIGRNGQTTPVSTPPVTPPPPAPPVPQGNVTPTPPSPPVRTPRPLPRPRVLPTVPRTRPQRQPRPRPTLPMRPAPQQRTLPERPILRIFREMEASGSAGMTRPFILRAAILKSLGGQDPKPA